MFLRHVLSRDWERGGVAAAVAAELTVRYPRGS